MKLGRPSGPARSLRLDAHADKIDEYLAKGIDKRSVAKLLDVGPNSLDAWLKVRRSGAAAAHHTTSCPARVCQRRRPVKVQLIVPEVVQRHAHAGCHTGRIAALEFHAYALLVFEHQQALR